MVIKAPTFILVTYSPYIVRQVPVNILPWLNLALALLQLLLSYKIGVGRSEASW